MVRRQVSRQDIRNVLREFTFERGGRVTLKEFVAETGIPESQIRRHFGSWTALRKEQGWSDQDRDCKRHSDEDLWEALHALIQKLGRFPTNAEIDRRTPFAARTYYTRFGPQPQVVQAYRRWLRSRDEQSACPEQPLPSRDQYGDVRWLRERWGQLRVTFELRSSDFRDRPAHHWDLLVVLQHDWPACPVKVLRLCDVLPEARDVQPAEWVSTEPTRAELYGRMPWDG